MGDLPQKLRDHYEGQGLPPERLRSILAAGEAAKARRSSARWWWGLAAVFTVALSLLFLWREPSPTLRTADVAEAVRAYFADGEYQLAQISGQPAELAAWLREQGAPPFELPTALRDRPSFGCQVLRVGSHNVYLICFFLDGSADELTNGMPVKAEMTVTAPDGSMMKKTRPLVHLVVAPRTAFATPPAPGTTVALPLQNGWHYRTWTEGPTVYLAAAEAPAAEVAQAVGHL